ncbi:biopolymer transporter ExbB [Arsukibacterium sp. MJ3]|uniref:MotA/TolQ/ExbB proton channel family protein n=1 Tax=Arsukibacterium sp. MJ3 TaxID=1632859 RepID=UPI0006270A7F|nr:MotA/TolQ/ExbB proton channel family protein [Arsukibacterium sp. MJ3]KKO48140.1 biopolymer transporter ExbB [Arsukibacterium sp. MJ3]
MNKQHSAGMNPQPITSLLVLIACFTIVHIFYAGVIHPAASAVMESAGSSALFSIWVILKDVEQQVCFSLMFFCLFLIGYKVRHLWFKELALSDMDFLQKLDKSAPLDIDNALSIFEESKHKENPVLKTWVNCLRRFKNTGNIQHAADVIESSVESLAAQLENGNTMIRYIIWAIPSIGFVGTVRGIGQALAQADQALAGDIAGMTSSLGVAFNSTLVALFISLLLMLFMHMLNNLQDTMVLNTQQSCEKHLLSHLHN